MVGEGPGDQEELEPAPPLLQLHPLHLGEGELHGGGLPAGPGVQGDEGVRGEEEEALPPPGEHPVPGPASA